MSKSEDYTSPALPEASIKLILFQWSPIVTIFRKSLVLSNRGKGVIPLPRFYILKDKGKQGENHMEIIT